ncbi:hypothetical protein LOK74_18755 [Brevibacillus humidisoli]|uniref:hypothetical protein n=1 Tax=Brevibacillus humidisoli TaxID=2895522 RepID=UPI001E2BAC53|nr:hypothetical protein [Brevibacillus humidisoli]UFJ40055.1 hypothetical protein LOK74_18755 [Brevibacillus humidisoli]
MRVLIKEKEYFFENNVQAVEQMIELINTSISTSGLLFSHVIVDGVEIFADPARYISENLNNIELVKVHLVTPTEYLYDLLRTGKEYIGGAIVQLPLLVDEFYNVPTSDSWIKLSQLTEGIQWFQQTALFIQEVRSLPKWAAGIQDVFQFASILSQLEEAVNQEDSTMIGDIIQYEILPRFEDISRILVEIDENEVENGC